MVCTGRRAEHITRRSEVQILPRLRRSAFGGAWIARGDVAASTLQACGSDLDENLGTPSRGGQNLSSERGHRSVNVLGKRSKLAVIPLPPRVARAIDQVVGERSSGPLLLTQTSNRLNRHAATRIVNCLAKRAGITKHIPPHSLRHSFITAALDAGEPLRDVADRCASLGPEDDHPI
jgi:site-specific recombinase XerD